MSNSTLTVSQNRMGDVCVLNLSGRIDSTNSNELTLHFNNLLKAGEKSILLDFTTVLYLTSAAFRALLVATDEAERHSARLVLCGVFGHVRELFEMGGLLDAFTIRASRDEATSLFG